MTDKMALVKQNGRVENVVVAREGFTPPRHEGIVVATDQAASPGDYFDGNRFVSPQLTASGDETVINDGADAVTVTVSTEWPDPVAATLSVADLSESVEIPAAGSISREITTTDAAGSEIVMRVEPEDSEIRGATHTIEVIAA